MYISNNAFTRPDILHKERFPKSAPDCAVSEGRAIFGAFDGLIKDVNIHEAHRPLSLALPTFLNRQRIKEWEAYEVCFDEGFICGAIYNMGSAVFNVLMFYDRVDKTVKARQIFSYPRKCVQNSLINSVNSLKTGAFKAEIRNNLESGRVFISSDYSPRSPKHLPMGAELSFIALSSPVVTIMPLGENRPLYTYKNLFKAEGSIKIGDRVFKLNERSLGIIDDHKGYYHRHMHYDWMTCMGFSGGLPLGLNLCKNQALEPDKYCENILWLGERGHLLPNVDFQHLENGDWQVFDKYGSVSLVFHIHDSYKLNRKFLGNGADYTAPFGTVTGFVIDGDGNKITLDGMTAMGEDISYNNI
ncbi:MAG: DUF2804 family protein [Clostridiales bacterium]|nr:DUF2804 family protein [Clostridiales bacterium]